MNKSQVGDLLTVIVAFDRRTIGEADIEAWHLILAALDVTDCAQAVKDHYTTETTWLMPAHIVKIVAANTRARIAREATERHLAEVAAATAPVGQLLQGPPPRVEIGQRVPPANRGAGIGATVVKKREIPEDFLAEHERRRQELAKESADA